MKGGVAVGDVFISASPATNNTLEGSTNGDWVSWYIAFANSPLVLGYNPNSSFAAALRSEPWYKVITEPGFRLGRHRPDDGPEGQAHRQAINAAEQIYGRAYLAALTATTANVYPEQSLVGELQSGQLDAGFFYAARGQGGQHPDSEARQALPRRDLHVRDLDNAPHEAAAVDFVNYLFRRRA